MTTPWRIFILLSGVIAAMPTCAAPPLLPAVEAEDLIYTYQPANNGAGPLWCYGSTCLVRVGDRVFASGLETLPDAKPLNNCRWTLHERRGGKWQLMDADPKGRQREPCPLVGFQAGQLFLSSNPTLTAPDTYNGPAQPQVLRFDLRRPAGPPEVELPPWTDPPPFSEHSYRGFAGNGRTGEAILFNIWMYDLYYWSYRDRAGKWSANGKLPFPLGAEYEEPKPIRLCYPQIAVRDREVHILAISDIVEPVKAWREYKLELNKGKAWDYDFRRLFYTWTPDITTTPFQPWVEVASREQTAGHITNLDLWLDARGRAHLLWNELSVWNPAMRDKFFPQEKITQSLHYGLMEKGQRVLSQKLLSGGEGQSTETPGYARLHATPDGRLFCFYFVSGTNAQGQPVGENRIMELFPDGRAGEAVRVPLQCPFTSFMTATERGGSLPATDLEVLGDASGRAGISYARISLLNPVAADFTARARRTPEGSVVELDASLSRAATGPIRSYAWEADGVKATGLQAALPQKHGGPLTVALTVKDTAGHSRRLSRVVNRPPAPYDLGLKQWGLIFRTQAEAFSGEGGGTIHMREDKLAASGLSLSHWNSQGHWLEWEFSVPQEGEYFLQARYAVPENASRTLILDGQDWGVFAFPSSGGYGSATTDNWALALLTGPEGKPRRMRLTAGTHTVRLHNPDGTGLNLDYLDWVAATLPAPTPAPAGFRWEADEGFRCLLPLTGVVAPTRVQSDGGHGYTVRLGKQYPGEGSGRVSTLRLFEDGQELGPAHAAHAEIRAQGQGRYSHWGPILYFSASDNSDPRTNGRRYNWEIQEP